MSGLGRQVVITGSNGFLGWHTRAALLEENASVQQLKLGEQFDLESAVGVLSGVDRVIHIAGINRASEQEILDGNTLFAEQLSTAIRQVDIPPKVIAFANSSQVGNGSVYAVAKERAAGILAAVAEELGITFVDLRLPNLFGEHGRPFYNAVTATFCHLLSEGGKPEVQNDKDLTLLHAQDAADVLLHAVDSSDVFENATVQSVSGLLLKLEAFDSLYRRGEIPDVSSKFERDLFNTYRSYTIESLTPIALSRHADSRGSFFETIRVHGGTGQTSFSTTVPGVTRGDHFHRRKIERFTVLSGSARISLRKVFSDKVLTFDIVGDKPCSVDMPTMWSHNITNTGTETLYTMFWSNDLFDPTAPDTIPEVV